MEYTLMHKNLSVAQIEIDEEIGSISKIIEIYHEKHMPVGTVYTMHHETKAQRMALNHWWTGRSIPASRSGIREALDELGVYNTTLLLTHCMGLSLSDHYWIRPTNSDVKWTLDIKQEDGILEWLNTFFKLETEFTSSIYKKHLKN